MLAQKKKQTAGELISALEGLPPLAAADLRHLVELTRVLISEELDRRVDAAKKSRDGSGLPAEAIARDLVRRDCRCEAALRWLDGDLK